MKKKILIIDDEVDLVKLLDMRLKAENYFVLPLYTSSRAVEVAKRERPDLILLDVVMPDKDGYEVCRELKADQDTRGIPVILFTAKTDAEENLKEKYKAVHADGYIVKTFSYDKLIAKINEVFSSKK
ncbi:MAG: response regulator [Omnitrophica bacterium]|nr:response regulator [Candidatus Omnitrophota bacterium]